MNPDHLADTLELSEDQLRLLELLLEDEGVVTAGADAVVPRPGDGPAPLSFAQRRLWFIHRLEPESAAYNVPVALRLRGRVDPPLLRRCLAEVARRHQVLRTVFEERDGEPAQRVLEPGPVAVAVADLSGLPPGEREAATRRAMREEAARPFDLERGPLLRAALLRTAADEAVVLLTMHHVVSDEWSTAVLVREMSALHGAFARGAPSPLPELPVQYADFAAWQRERLGEEALERQLDYWRGRLAGVPPLLDLPTDRPRPAVPGRGAASRPFALSGPTSRALRELACAGGTTTFAVLLAGWQALLARWSGQDDVCVGTPVANRPRAELEGLVGFFVNTLVMRAELGGDPTVRELLARTRDAVVEAQEHQDVPFERVVEALGAGRSLRHTPLFQVLFTLQSALPEEALRLDGVEMEALHTESGSAKFDLVLELADGGERIAGRAEYRAELWDADTVDRMLAHYAALLEGMAADPERRLSRITTVGAEERRLLVEAWNATAEAYPRALCVHELFEAQADRAPDAPALRWAGGEMAFAELERRANRVAHRLRALGVGPDDRVGLCLERGPELIAAVLGILKAGAAYLPLDPGYPAGRLALMLADAGARALVTQASLEAALPDTDARVLRVDADAAELEAESGGRPRGGASPESLAYVIYTSGSTGVPKGVAMPHRPLANLLAWHLRHGSGPLRTLQFTTIGFDVSFQEIFACLCAGGTLVLVDEATRRDPAALLRQVEREGVERLFMPFAALQQLAEAAEERGVRPASLREVVTAGEQLRATDALRGWFGALGIPLHNHYGPSETHVATAHALRGDAAAWPLLAPIGRPIANARCYVLDPAGEPAPLGAPGELFLGGAIVARGYLGRPDLTAERFVPDPFAGASGARMYRPGDRARWTAADVLEFLGRTDDQVKVRGFRIEPGEVEAALEAHPAVREAVVVAREDAPGDRRLVGYVLPAGGAPSPAELRGWLGERLPEHMVPTAVVVLDAFPLTPSGKVARRALPAPDGRDGTAEHVPPRTATEIALAAVWAEVLHRERVGAHDDFFALGGHSLLATRVVSRLRAALGVELELRAVFEAPTLAGLAARVDALLAPDAPPGAPLQIRVERIFGGAAGAHDAAEAPLSFAQQRLWLVDRMEPGSAAYNMPAGLRLRGRLDAALLERTLAEVVRRHEALRTVFREGRDGPVQVVLPAGRVRVPLLDLAGLAPEARERELLLRAAAAAARPFDLARGPLLRATLLRLAPEEHALVFVVHHVVSDGWSMGVLVDEVSAIYDALGRGRPSPLPEPPLQYRDYAAWQRRHLSGERLEAQLAWWRGRLAGAPPVLELPTDRPRGAVPGRREAAAAFAVPAVTTHGLRALARGEGATLFAALLAGWQVLLAGWAGEDDVVVGAPVAGRTRSELEGLIGFFVNTLVLRTDLGGDPSLRDAVRRAWEGVLGAQAHQELPFDRLVEELQPERSVLHPPLFQVTFTLQGAGAGVPRLGGLAAEPLETGAGEAKFDLGMDLREDGDALAGTLSYRAGLWEPGTVARVVERFLALLDLLAVDPERRLSALELVGSAERERLEAWSRSAEAAPPPPARCLHELFAEQAERTPGAVALVAGDRSLTYAELHARSDALARVLAGRGVGPDARVGICMERGPELVVGLLAILRAGGAYVPLDPAYPAERIRYMLADAGVGVLLTQDSLRERFDGFAGQTVLIDGAATQEDAGAPSHSRTPALSHSPSPDHLAYVIYTSGSTGRPKGTEVPHRAVPGFFRGADYARWDASTVVLQHSSVSWDALTLELWPALLSGGTCVLYPGATTEPGELGEQVRGHGVDTLWLTAAYFNLVVDSCPEVLAGVRQVMTGGEAVSAPHVRRALELYPELRLVNGYGPSETTVFATCWPVPRGFDGAAVPIGRPVGDRRVYLVDRLLVRVPVGVPGELCVGGPAVARGYLGRPELTAERFVPDPFSGEPGARMYRSGDRARWTEAGELEFVGRLDAQAKVRGFRVEPGEVEAVLLSHPGVREAAVVVREAGPGDLRLAGYVTAADGAVPDAAELRAWLGARLPEHMVPAWIGVLDAMPLTARGKTDRRALPAPEAGAAEAYAPPRTPTEEILAGLWAGLLGVERVGRDAGFFDLGGHSLLATRLVARVREALGAELPLRAVFEAPTVAGLAARVDAARGGAGEADGAPPIARAPRDGPLPLSFAQQRLWFLHRMEPESPAYNVPAALRLRGRLDAAALERALAGVVRRHESLRTVFAERGGEPVQVVLDDAAPELRRADLRGLQPAERERAAARLAREEALRPFDLARGPLLRAALLRLDEEEWVLLFAMHHVASDGWSVGVLVREVGELYAAFAEGRGPALPELPVQYADYAAWQRAWLVGDALERRLAWWRGRLAGAPPLLELPTDRPRPAVQDGRGGAVAFRLSARTAHAVRAIARDAGATPFMALLAAWQALLARWSGQDDVLVGTPVAGRTRVELEGLIGFFVNTLVLRAELSGDPGFRALLGRVREAALGAYAHQDVPFERLVEEMQPERTLRHTPLFQAMFALQNAGGGELELGGLRAEPLESAADVAKFDLDLQLAEEGDGLAGALVFRAELFDAATAERLAAHFAALLEGALAAPDAPLARLPLMDAAERARVLEAGRAPAAAHAFAPVHAGVAAQARRTPGAPAVAWERGTLTYAELDARASRLARWLRGRGVGPETRVGICLERGPELAVAMLAVLRAGGAYLPLDPGYPAARLEHALDDSGAAVLLTQERLLGGLPDTGAEIVCVDADAARIAREPAEDPGVETDPDALAYLIYTSGSTGTPKGVGVPHRALANHMAWMLREWPLAADDRVLQKTPAAFDASVWEFWAPLLSGATLVMARPDAHRDPAELARAVAAERITVLQLVPSVLAAMLAEGRLERGTLRLLFCGGEALPARDAARAREAAGAEVVNLYGPTEACIDATWHRVTGVEGGTTVPIGRAVDGVAAHVLDPDGEPAPWGVPGELCLGGAQLARGYLGRPDATAAAFVPDPFADEGGARLYRTGDRARRLADGALEYLGRLDQQLKVRGFRIEPGEVEAALRAHSGVREAAVGVRGGRLVGWVVAAEGGADAEALRAHLRRTLPEHMVPAALAVLDALPLTPGGKLDRRALPAPAGADGAAYVAPRTPAEARLADVFAEVLGVERVGVDDDFFALGGHSLLATRVTSRVAHAFGVELPVRALFEEPTVAGLAARLPAVPDAEAQPPAEAAPPEAGSARPEAEPSAPEREPAVPASEPAPPAAAPPELTPERRLLLQRILQARAEERRRSDEIRRAPRDRPLPLSFAQQRLWFIDQLQPGNPAYHIPAPLALRGALDVRALRRALAGIVRRHEALRTVFRETDGAPEQVVLPAGPVPLPVVDLAGIAEEARERETGRLSQEHAARPFDLRRGPLFRGALVRRGAAEWALLIAMHHIVSDGWSIGVLVGDFSPLYDAFRRGLPSPLPEPRVQYADFAAWQREWLAGGRMQEQLAYWRRRLAGAPPTLDLPTDHPRPAVPGLRGRSHRWELSPAASRAVGELCRREGITPYMAFLAAWQLLLARWAGTEDVSVGTGIAGRNRLELEGLVGFFVNTLVLRTELAGRPSVRETLRRVREATLDAFANQDVPFERLVEELAPERSLQHAPLVQAMFTFQNNDLGRMDAGELELEALDHRAEAAKFDLSLLAWEDEQGGEHLFRGSIVYRTDLFEPATPERMERHLAALLLGLAGDPERAVAELPLMDARERAAVLAASAGPVRERARDLLVHDLFRRQAARTPDAPALSWDGGEATYAELDARTDRLAAALARRGVAPGTRVAVFQERGPEWIESMLAVLKAGAVYVPLDPALPAERTRWMLEDSGAALVLTSAALRGRLPAFAGEVVALDTPHPPAPSPTRGEGEHDGAEDRSAVAGCSLFPVPCSLSLAYVVYTSGSTGRPKGALVGHGGAAGYLEFLAEEYGLGPGDAVLQVATPTFDASIRETLGALTTGARLVLSPPGELAEPRRLLERVRERGVTAVMAIVPSVLRPVLAEARPGEARLRLLLVSGEPLPVADARRAREVFGAELRVVNQWGATECTMSSTLHTVADDEEAPIAPVGVPIPNTRVYVLDGELEPTPFGVPGEAYIATPGLAHGYGGRPELTAERFVPDPFAAEPGARMYRVGDRLRRRPDGVLEFLGRVDGQVKVQGVRVEPGEVEAALREHPAVESAAVAAREVRPGEARLVACVVGSGGARPTAAELRAYLADRLPPYMVPGGWAMMDALPLLPNGKLDRRALPDPEASARAEYAAPATPTEVGLAAIWAEVLGADRVGAGDDFFALGGHSLLATRMISRVRRAFAVELPLRALFEAPTLAGTAARIDAALRAGEAIDAAPVLPVPRDGRPLPLSFAQRRIWFLQELEPESAAYNMPHPLRLEGAPDVPALRRALELLAARHETLRTVFGRAGGEPVQTVLPAGRVPLPLVDLAGLPEEVRRRETRRLVAAEALRPFDLARGPLLRALLVRAGAEEHGLLFTLHHVVADGWSLGILVREVSEAYSAFAEGREPRLPALPVQYADYAVWQRRRLEGEAMERQVAFWRAQLADAPPLLDLPTDRPRPAVATQAGARVPFQLPAELAASLDALARREGATPFMALMAAWQALLGRWSGQDDVLVGTPIAGRTRAETEGLIGMFVNTLVLRTRLDGRPTFRELLARVRETTLGAYAHQDVPFERLVEELQPERSLRHAPVFQVTFAMQNLEAEALRLGGLRLSPLDGGGEAAKFDLTLVMSGGAERLGGTVSFRTDLFDARTVERMLARFRALLEAVAADPERRPADVELLDAAERRRLLVAHNAPGAVPAPTRTVHELFAEQARRTPDAPALRFGGATITYAELDRRSAALARELLARGVGPDARVGLLAERSADMVAGMLAVLRAGGAYLPLDPEYPAERLAWMLEDAGARVLLAQGALLDRVPEFAGEIVALDTPHPPAPSPTRGEGEHDGAQDGAAVAVAGCSLSPLTCPLSLAYVVYTSGSTGTPKGVAVPHRAVVRLVRDADFAQLGPGDRVAQVANAAFDAATWEVWGALLNGGCVVGIDRDTTLMPQRLAEALRREGVTGMFITSALFAQTVAAAPDAFATVRHLLTGGDAMDPGAARRALAAGAPGRLVNAYGPTENTVFSTWHPVAAVEADAWTVPIGRPIAGSTAYVLDPAGEPVPEGWPGELCVGGWGVARGYLGRPGLTADRFVPDAFGGVPGARLYRTGDRARWSARGELEFLGRADFQVKVRGFRVEPGEVEAALAAHPAVNEAVVVLRADASGDRRLVGYAAADPEAGPSGADLRAYLRGRLPEHMVPSAVVVLATLPLTANGKTDRRALPDPEPGADDAGAPPRTPTEQTLAEIYAEVLGAARVGIHAGFFDLGGHSLLATRAILRIREAFGVDVPLRALFEAPTVAGLAGVVEELLVGEMEGGPADEPPAPEATGTPGATEMAEHTDGTSHAEAAPGALAGGVLDRLTPEQRALLLRKLRRQRTAAAEEERIPRRTERGPAPLSFAQQRLWFIDQLQPGSPAYNIPEALRIRGPLDVAALRATLAEVVRRHEVLRTVFRATEQGAEAVPLPAGPVAIPVAALDGLPEAEREAAVARLLAEESARPFDLARGPLLRAGLLRLSAEEHVMLFTMHHIVSDGWSMGVLVREVTALYAAYSRGLPPALPELPVQYADFAAWQRGWLADGALERQLAFWRGRLADAPATLELPVDRPVSAAPSYRGTVRRFDVGRETMERLRALGRAEGATLFMTVLAAWQALLGRWSGQHDVLVGTPVAGRTRAEVEELIGFFANTLVIRTDLAAPRSFRELLRRVRGGVLEAHGHQDVPFEKLVEELHPERDVRQSPFFRVMFAVQMSERETLRLGPVTMEGLVSRVDAAKFDLSMLFNEGPEGMSGGLTFRTELWDASTIDRLLGHFATLLEAVAAGADAPPALLPVLPAAERRQVLVELNDTRRDYPAGLRVHDLFAAQALRTPDAPAVSFRGDVVTYAELAARSGRLANHLRGLGVGPETRVGVCMERTPELVVALLAVLRAGGAYVPLDPAYPRERLGWMQEDARVSLVLTSSALADALPAGTRTLDLDAVRAEVESEAADVPESGVLPENLSHVIFTSGSTGRPKGVMIRHSSVVVLLHWLRENVTDEERGASLFSTSINFDVSVAEVFGVLSWGGRLVLVENALELAGVAEPVVHASMVPTAAAELLRTGGIPASVRTLNLGGEPLPGDLARALYELPHVQKVGNLYGPTEDTTYSTYSVVGRGGSQVFVGRPVANTRALVLDAELEPVPLGVVGELYLAGDGLSRGYAGRPELTAERYLPDPHGEPGSRMYRVMDRVRWRPDGELEYFGRTDFQVKVRGFRIELGEIETALRSHPAVREAVALVREDEPGERRIVAYVAAAGGAAPEAAELRAHLRERVPEYMLPSAYVVLEALPLTPNGKLDRRALPAPEAEAGAASFAAPRTPTEEVLAGIFADVLGAARVDAHADFFDLGGHSLLATRVVGRAREAFGVDVELGVLFEAPTVASLAARVDALLREGAGMQAPPLLPVARGGELPLSFAQQRLWFIDQLQPGSAAYNIPAALRIRGPLDAAALETALAELVRRHEALRTTFAATAGRAVQVVHPAGAFSLPRLDLADRPEAEREAELRRLADADEAAPFDLAAGPLLRLLLMRLADDDHALLVNMHHIVSDAWSIDVMVREVAELYGAFREGRPSPLPELPVQYADYAAWQRAWLVGEVLERQLGWWRERLAGAPPVLELPTDRPRPRLAGTSGGRVALQLPPETADAVRALARREGATPYMTLMAAWQALLGRHAGQSDVVVGMPVAGRSRAETEGLIGFFVNTLVIRTGLDDDPDARTLVRRVRAATLGAHQHQDVPFERLVEELGVERSLDHTPLFQVVFNFRGGEGGAARLAGAELERMEGSGGAAKFDLTLTMADGGGELAGSLGFRADLFDAATMERLTGHFARLLRGMTESPGLPVSRLPLLDAAERRHVLESLNDTRRDYPAGLRVHDLFAAQAARTPDAPAVSFRGDVVTYVELAARSGRLANRLRALGVGPETRVGVCLERTPELVVALLAVLRAGGAYVPLDPAYPRERLGWMQEDARVSLVLTSSALAGALPAGTRALALDAVRAGVDAEPEDVPESGVLPENLSHVIFTSGSTGRPKGVMIRHSSVVVLLHWLRENVSDEERGASLFSTSINFDVSVAEVFGVLSWGGRLVLVENALELAGVTEPVVHASMVPTAAAELLRTGGIPASVRTLNLGGEALPSDLAQALYRQLPTVRKVGNLYGPTEDTTYSTYSVVRRGGSQVFVGRPVANTRALVLDSELEPVPLGVVGELYLAGDGLSRGYAGAPEMTAERYLPDPHGEPGSRMYRVMDRVRWRPDGELEYFGRTDFQVKVRGFRIEPGEIETALRSAPGVRDAVVVVREDTPGNRRLVAYVAAAPGPRPSVADLRAWLRDAVPEHMVPSAFLVLESLPMTPNGKLDRRALPAPEGRPEGGEEYVAPRTPTEEALAAIWAELLEVGRVGANDNFFDLGGHSLLVVQLHARLKESIAPRLSVADLFGIRTLADLARQVDTLREAEDDVPSREETLHRADARRSRLGRQRSARGARPGAEDDAEDE
ncbi:MAG TPA: non-ribosomal peptide synthase/polyketide synthase [Longimicrobiaceae bacterium]|jgi:amino acid adenylation domain-containing protein